MKPFDILLSGFLGAVLALFGTYGLTWRKEKRQLRSIATVMAFEMLAVRSEAARYAIRASSLRDARLALEESKVDLFALNADLFTVETVGAVMAVGSARLGLQKADKEAREYWDRNSLISPDNGQELTDRARDVVGACRVAALQLESEGAERYEEFGELVSKVGQMLFPSDNRTASRVRSPVNQSRPYWPREWAPFGSLWHWVCERVGIDEKFR